MKIEWLVTNVRVIESPGRVERAILGVLLVPSSASWPFLAQKIQITPILRSHTCTAFPVEFFVSEKNVTNLHAMKIRNIFFLIKRVNPNPVAVVQRFGIFQK